MKNKQKTNAQGRRCSGTVEVSPHKKTFTAIFAQSNAHAQGNDPLNRGFPEQANCNGVMVMSEEKGDKGCLYRHASSPGMTPTRRRHVGRPRASSPRLLVMPWRQVRSCSQQQSLQADRKSWSMHAWTKTWNTIYQLHAERRR